VPVPYRLRTRRTDASTGLRGCGKPAKKRRGAGESRVRRRGAGGL